MSFRTDAANGSTRQNEFQLVRNSTLSPFNYWRALCTGLIALLKDFSKIYCYHTSKYYASPCAVRFVSFFRLPHPKLQQVSQPSTT